jgi:hypothetical protein
LVLDPLDVFETRPRLKPFMAVTLKRAGRWREECSSTSSASITRKESTPLSDFVRVSSSRMEILTRESLPLEPSTKAGEDHLPFAYFSYFCVKNWGKLDDLCG